MFKSFVYNEIWQKKAETHLFNIIYYFGTHTNKHLTFNKFPTLSAWYGNQSLKLQINISKSLFEKNENVVFWAPIKFTLRFKIPFSKKKRVLKGSNRGSDCFPEDKELLEFPVFFTFYFSNFIPSSRFIGNDFNNNNLLLKLMLWKESWKISYQVYYQQSFRILVNLFSPSYFHRGSCNKWWNSAEFRSMFPWKNKNWIFTTCGRKSSKPVRSFSFESSSLFTSKLWNFSRFKKQLLNYRLSIKIFACD